MLVKYLENDILIVDLCLSGSPYCPQHSRAVGCCLGTVRCESSRSLLSFMSLQAIVVLRVSTTRAPRPVMLGQLVLLLTIVSLKRSVKSDTETNWLRKTITNANLAQELAHRHQLQQQPHRALVHRCALAPRQSSNTLVSTNLVLNSETPKSP